MADSKDPILLDFPESFETERLLIRAPLWGDGVSMYEAIRESIDELRPWMAFAQVIPTLEESEKVFAIRELGANRLEIFCSARNTKSAAVAERAGFTLEGILRSANLGYDGERHDSKVFAKVRGIEF
ncbi:MULTISPECIES: GNAT family N-acetyltransferase [Paenibacillus]|uniref:GNAT family N-acetyltransferase n=1 Tax=Paenibacillus TaxID=44249 RepID=UPI0028997F98|nr:GNAT family N-acetyltransferase [Paenibacillus odorifer]